MDNPIWNHVIIGNFTQHIQYENLPTLCYTCGKIGHSLDKCTCTSPNPKKGLTETTTKPLSHSTTTLPARTNIINLAPPPSNSANQSNARMASGDEILPFPIHNISGKGRAHVLNGNSSQQTGYYSFPRTVKNICHLQPSLMLWVLLMIVSKWMYKIL